LQNKSKLLGLFVFTANGQPSVMGYATLNNSTSFAGGPTYQASAVASWPNVCLGMQDDGTTRKVAWSYDKATWFLNGFAGEPNTDFLTPTHVGYTVNSNGSGVPSMIVWSEEFVTGTLF
jgi:hypothetical protein